MRRALLPLALTAACYGKPPRPMLEPGDAGGDADPGPPRLVLTPAAPIIVRESGTVALDLSIRPPLAEPVDVMLSVPMLTPHVEATLSSPATATIPPGGSTTISIAGAVDGLLDGTQPMQLVVDVTSGVDPVATGMQVVYDGRVVSTEKRVFVTTRLIGTPFAPQDLDALCQQELVDLPQGFRAFLADTPSGRFPGGSGWVVAASQSYYKLDQETLVLVTTASAQLGGLRSPLGGGLDLYWSGFDCNYNVAYTCQDWQSSLSTDSPTVGNPASPGGNTSDEHCFGGGVCSNNHKVLCLEQ